jgi:hypothetical protein
VPHINTITSLLLLALIFPACDEAVDSRYDDFRSGTDTTSDTGDTTDDTTDGGDPWPESIAQGQNFGPCFSDVDHIYHWCDTLTFPNLVCAVPQEDDMPHATVCVERRAEGACPATEWFSIGNDLSQAYPVEQDYWNACSLACAAAGDCPVGMACTSDVCAWETF